MRATAYGGAIGLGAALVKSLAPWSDMQSSSAVAKEDRRHSGIRTSVRAGGGIPHFHPAPADGVGVSIEKRFPDAVQRAKARLRA